MADEQTPRTYASWESWLFLQSETCLCLGDWRVRMLPLWAAVRQDKDGLYIIWCIGSMAAVIFYDFILNLVLPRLVEMSKSNLGSSLDPEHCILLMMSWWQLWHLLREHQSSRAGPLNTVTKSSISSLLGDYLGHIWLLDCWTLLAVTKHWAYCGYFVQKWTHQKGGQNPWLDEQKLQACFMLTFMQYVYCTDLPSAVSLLCEPAVSLERERKREEERGHSTAQLQVEVQDRVVWYGRIVSLTLLWLKWSCPYIYGYGIVRWRIGCLLFWFEAYQEPEMRNNELRSC